MFGFLRKNSGVVQEKKEEVAPNNLPIQTPSTSTSEDTAVEEAIRIIQHHLDKEAVSRRVDHLTVRDLCPRQKADLYRDLVKLFS